MKTISFTNNRITSRNNLEIKGFINIKENKEVIIINNISMNGLQIIFSDNDFLYKLMEECESDNSELSISFILDIYDFSIKCKINWIKIFDIGEKSFYVLAGLNYNQKYFNSVKDKLISLLVDINMTNFYIGKIERIEESLIG